MPRKLKVLAVIPARGGSKGVPRKNARDLCGHPLIYYPIQAAKNCSLIDKVIVSTDDKEIIRKAEECGAEIPFVRPESISGDKVSLIPVCQHAMRFFDEQSQHYDAILSLQPTSPFVTAEILNKVVSLLIETGCDSVVTVHEIIHGHPYRAKKLLADSRLDNFFEEFNGDTFLQKQDRPPAYAYNGAVYLRKRDLLENYNGKDFGLGNDVRAVCMSTEDSVNIDTESDFRMAEFIMKEIRGKRAL